jgi:hypothetical protein
MSYRLLYICIYIYSIYVCIYARDFVYIPVIYGDHRRKLNCIGGISVTAICALVSRTVTQSGANNGVLVSKVTRSRSVAYDKLALPVGRILLLHGIK